MRRQTARALRIDRTEDAQRAHAFARKAMRILNSGYSEGGASRGQNYARGWNDRGGSPVEDVSLNLDLLRRRSRDLYMNSQLGRAAINRIKTNAVGRGLRVKFTPDAVALSDLLGREFTPEELQIWGRKAEREFNLWANSRDCDKLRLDTFWELQSLALLSWLQNGDCFALLPMIPGRGPYELAVHLIEADRVCNPGSMMGFATPGITAQVLPNGNRIENGVEIGADGGVAAYHVAGWHPLSTDYTAKNRGKWTRVPVRDEVTGRLNIIHMRTAERTEQWRGVPYLAAAIKPLKQLERYTQAELEAAVVAGLFTAFITNTSPEGFLQDGLLDTQKVSAGQADEDKVYELGSGAVVELNPGQGVSSASPGRPNAGYDVFFLACAKGIGAALDQPYEVILQAYNASYSASLAAIGEAWKTYLDKRYGLIYNFNDPITEEFMWEAVLKGFLEAPGFADDPRVRAAWLGKEWTGPAKGTIKPLEELQADEKGIELGLTTHRRVARERFGTDFDTNVAENAAELALMQEAGMIPAGTPG